MATTPDGDVSSSLIDAKVAVTSSRVIGTFSLAKAGNGRSESVEAAAVLVRKVRRVADNFNSVAHRRVVGGEKPLAVEDSNTISNVNGSSEAV